MYEAPQGGPKKEMIDMAQTITPAEFAEVVGSDGRTVRKFLRHELPDKAPGKGARWSLPGTKREVASLQKKFDAWKAAQEEARAKKAEAETEEVEEIEEDDTED